MASIPTDHVKSFAWYIDFDASRHFTHRRDWFVEFTPYSDSIIFGGGEEYNIVDKGNVQIQSGGKRLMFLNVCYVSGMKHNLLSVSQIIKHFPQLDVVFSGNKCSIIDRASCTTLAVGLEDHSIYRLVDLGDSLKRAFIAKSSALSSLWHQRYGRLNIQYLAQLARDNLVHGPPDIQTQNHHVC